MILSGNFVRSGLLVGAVGLLVGLPVHAQTEQHGRRYKPLPPASKVSVTVEKASNGKPIENAAVIFNAYQNGRKTGTMETKTDPDGVASIDVIEVGSHVQVQVIADGYATNASEFDLGKDEKKLLLKMEKPRAQVSAYENNDGKAAQISPGVQEPKHAPVAAKPSSATAMPQAKTATPTPVAPAASPETAPTATKSATTPQ
jgi:hypothetical protein